VTLDMNDLDGLGSLENVAKWEYEKRAIEGLRERESKVARALDRAQLYADEYPSDSVSCDEGIEPLTAEELRAARHLFPNMTVGVPENHGKEGYAGEFKDGWLFGQAPRPYPGGLLDDTPLEHIRTSRPFSLHRPLPAGLHIPLPNGRGWVRAKLNESHLSIDQPIESSESDGVSRPLDFLPGGVTLGMGDGRRAVSLSGPGDGSQHARDKAADFLAPGGASAHFGSHNQGSQTSESRTPAYAVKVAASSGGPAGSTAVGTEGEWMNLRDASAMAEKFGY